jgi:hypothetical protein
MDTFCQKLSRFGWRIVFFSGIPHPHLLGEPLPESPLNLVRMLVGRTQQHPQTTRENPRPNSGNSCLSHHRFGSLTPFFQNNIDHQQTN